MRKFLKYGVFAAVSLLIGNQLPKFDISTIFGDKSAPKTSYLDDSKNKHREQTPPAATFTQSSPEQRGLSSAKTALSKAKTAIVDAALELDLAAPDHDDAAYQAKASTLYGVELAITSAHNAATLAFKDMDATAAAAHTQNQGWVDVVFAMPAPDGRVVYLDSAHELYSEVESDAVIAALRATLYGGDACAAANNVDFEHSAHVYEANTGCNTSETHVQIGQESLIGGLDNANNDVKSAIQTHDFIMTIQNAQTPENIGVWGFDRATGHDGAPVLLLRSAGQIYDASLKLNHSNAPSPR